MKKEQNAIRKSSKTLSITKETLRLLDDRNLAEVVGGMEGSGQTGCRPPYTCRVN